MGYEFGEYSFYIYTNTYGMDTSTDCVNAPIPAVLNGAACAYILVSEVRPVKFTDDLVFSL